MERIPGGEPESPELFCAICPMRFLSKADRDFFPEMVRQARNVADTRHRLYLAAMLLGPIVAVVADKLIPGHW
jgi:hypothetical protein